MTEANIINEFGIGDISKRISIILYNLPIFEGLIDSYREDLIDEIHDQVECNQRGPRDDLGVRVQTSGISDDKRAKV